MRPPRGRLAAFAGLLAAAWAGSGPSLWAAGTKADGSGNIRITDDLVNGTAGSVGLTGVGGLELSGSMGQIATAEATGGSTTTESGYFSRMVSQPISPNFSEVYSSSVNVTWSPGASSPPGTLYEVVLSTDPSFSTLYPSPIFTGALSTSFTALTHDTTYYLRVRAGYMEGDDSDWRVGPSTKTRIETEPPTITDLQGGDLTWRRVNNSTYNVNFADTGGSFLSHFSVKASTLSNDSGLGLTGGFVDLVPPGSINADIYTADWLLPGPVFNALLEGVTNYITVKVIDGALNSTMTVDAFFVKKDTTPPVIDDFQPGENVWRNADPLSIYNVDFKDPASGLKAIEYSAWTGLNFNGTNPVPWTPVAAIAPGQSAYTANWAVNFSLLQDGATNYISVRAWDITGSSSPALNFFQFPDIFTVLKDTSPPTVTVVTPANGGFRSNLAAIAGTSFDVQPIAGVEINVKRLSDNCYWNPATNDFISTCVPAPPVWFPAPGGLSWSTATAIPWASYNAVEFESVARSSDAAGNYSLVYSTSRFTMDTGVPTAGIVVPPTGLPATGLSMISGTAADSLPTPNSGISTVDIQFRRNSDNLWWNFFNETAASPWQAVAVSSAATLTGPTSWTHGPSPYLKAHLKSGATYFITVRASDNAVPPNSGAFMVANSTFSFLDTTAPAATTLQASSTSLPGELKLTWTARGDDGASGYTLYSNPEEMFRIYYATFSFGVGPTTASAQGVIQSMSPTLVTLLVPGAVQTWTRVLADGTTYYAAVWQKDNEGNWSVMSNVSSAITTPIPPNKILGHVVNASTQGITGVTVEAFDTAGTLRSTAFTLNDGSGSYALDGLPPASYKVQVAWTANGITSSVWKDNIPMGSRDVDFVLEVTYTLGTISGQIQSMAVSGGTGGGGYTVSSAYEVPGSGAYVELYQNGRRVAKGGVEPDGRFAINNLLPGQYAVRAFNGLSFTEMIEVSLLEGENHDVTFVWDPLPEKSVFAFPNPARKSVVFRFETNLSPLEAQIAVFDIAGNLVREIPGGEMNSPKPGLYHADWNLANAKGEAVASGVYLFMVKVKNTSNGQTSKVVKKLAVIR